MSGTIQRVMLATLRDNIEETTVLRDELPALEQDEIRMRVEKVGLSANNLFYAQMGEAPFLKFFAVYPLTQEYKHLANLPAWGVGTVIESANSEFAVGEQFRGFLHLTNVVQMKARRTPAGFEAYGGKRDKLNPGYNGFLQLREASDSPIRGSGEKPDLAMTSSPGALSGFMLYELLKMNDFYQGNSVILTSASSKLSLSTALLLRDECNSGSLKKVIGYTSASNKEFVTATGLYDEVLTYSEQLPQYLGTGHVLVDVAGDATIYKQTKDRLVKGFAVGGTHADAEASTFTAFSPSGFLKMFIDMMGPKFIKNWANKALDPTLEMFFAPNVANELLLRWGQDEMDKRSNAALKRFVDAAIDGGWITVDRSEDIPSIQAAYRKIVTGKLPPSEAVIVSLCNVGEA